MSINTKIAQPLLTYVPKVHPKAKTKLKLRFQTFRCHRKAISQAWRYEFVQEFSHIDDALKSCDRLSEEKTASIHPELMDYGMYDTESKMFLQKVQTPLI